MNKLYKALAAVKKEMESVKKSSNNPFFKSRYADLNSHLEVVEPLMEKNGLLLLQPCEVSPFNGKTAVSTQIIHIESGEKISSTMAVDTVETDMQKAGGGVTYARRYTLSALLGMQAVDDDANEFTGKTSKATVDTKTTTTYTKATFAKPKANGATTTKPTDDF